MIEFRGLSKSYTKRGRPALLPFELEVRKGEILGLVGLNGAGKTTLIRSAAGLILPTAGTVLLDGHDIVTDKIRASATVGWVSEFPNFEPSARAADLLEYLAGYNGLRGPEALPWVLGILRQVGLEGDEWQRVGTFSQGMKKRFALATALVARPTNLLFDELLNGLDPEGIRYVRSMMLTLRKEGASVLLSSHLLGEVENLADRIAIVHEGRLLEVLPREALLSSRGRSLRIVLHGPGDGALDYLSTVGKVTAEGTTYRIADPRTEAWQVTEELVRRGYHVAEVRTEHEDLESYFFRRIRGAG